jgi:hypothetical protein
MVVIVILQHCCLAIILSVRLCLLNTKDPWLLDIVYRFEHVGRVAEWP